MPDKIRWGIISTARIGRKRVIPAIQKSSNGEVVVVASRSLDKAKAFANEVGIPKAFGSYQEMIESGEVDAIYNPLPNSEHVEWSIRCAEAGVPCLCEKPLAGNATDAQKMVDAFNTQNVLLAEAFMWRFHPRSVRVKEMLDAGAIGEIKAMNATFTFFIGDESDIRLNPELEGGALLDVGCYCLSSMRFLLGEEPDGGKAFARIPPGGVDEMLTAALSFPSGVVAHFDCGFRAQKTNFYDIRGTEGRIRVEDSYTPDADVETTIHYWQSKFDGSAFHNSYEEIKFLPVDQYTLMAEDFADAILNNRPPQFPAQDAVAQLKVIDRLLADARGESTSWAE